MHISDAFQTYESLWNILIGRNGLTRWYWRAINPVTARDNRWSIVPSAIVNWRVESTKVLLLFTCYCLREFDWAVNGSVRIGSAKMVGTRSMWHKHNPNHEMETGKHWLRKFYYQPNTAHTYTHLVPSDDNSIWFWRVCVSEKGRPAKTHDHTNPTAARSGCADKTSFTIGS